LKNGGLIKSENYAQGKKGFQIKANGDAEFNDAVFREHVEATSGYIKDMNIDNVTIGNDALFLGVIKTGPVFISNETTAPVAPTVFNSGARVRDVVDSIGRNTTKNVSSGYYGNKSGIISLTTTYTAGAYNYIGQNIPYRWTLRILFNDGTYTELTDTTIYEQPNDNTNNLTVALSIGGSQSGNVFRIYDVPIGSAGLPTGTVYRNGNQLCIV